MSGGGRHGAVETLEDGLAGFAGEIEPTGFGEVLEHPLVGGLAIYASNEVVEVLERTVLFAFFDDAKGSGFTDTLDAGESKSDFSAAGDGGEVLSRFIDVGALNLDPHGEGFVDEVGHFVGVAEFGGEYRGHEFDGVVGFEKCGLVGDDGVGGGVGFVKTVFREFVQNVEDLVGLLGGDVVDPRRAFGEFFALPGHGFHVLLAHGAPEHVRTTERVAGDDLGTLHHLFLVDDDAVGFLEHILEKRMGILDGGGVVLTLGVGGNELHRTRTIEGRDRIDVIDAGNAHLPGGVLHTR